MHTKPDTMLIPYESERELVNMFILQSISQNVETLKGTLHKNLINAAPLLTIPLELRD